MYKRFQSLHELNLPDVKELLDQTLFTIKGENERLQQNLNQAKSIDDAIKPTNIDPDSQNINEQRQQASSQVMSDLLQLKEQQTNDKQTLLKTTVEDEYEPSLHGKILQLSAKGLSNDEIAQTLNCGTTEVELILRFNRNK